MSPDHRVAYFATNSQNVCYTTCSVQKRMLQVNTRKKLGNKYILLTLILTGLNEHIADVL